MKIYFHDLDSETKNKIIVETMDSILEEEKREKPKTNQEWFKLWEDACDKVNNHNFAIDIEY
jgi:hypothetical protein